MRDLNSMFLDEGFGTLDRRPWTRLPARWSGSLPDSDRMVGLITHVAGAGRAGAGPVRGQPRRERPRRSSRSAREWPGAGARVVHRGSVGSGVRHGVRRGAGRATALDESSAELNLDLELPAGAVAAGRPLTPALAVPGTVLFLDGVRRIDARVWVHGPGRSRHRDRRVVRGRPGLLRRRGAVGDVSVERGLFTAAAIGDRDHGRHGQLSRPGVPRGLGWTSCPSLCSSGSPTPRSSSP